MGTRIPISLCRRISQQR